MRAGDVLFRPTLRRDTPAPFLICLLAWAVLSALTWAAIAFVLHLL